MGRRRGKVTVASLTQVPITAQLLIGLLLLDIRQEIGNRSQQLFALR